MYRASGPLGNLHGFLVFPGERHSLQQRLWRYSTKLREEFK
jgi:hypothetical protein